MFSAFARMNYKAWFAVAEFVDNSIQSYLWNKERLHEVEGEGYQLQIDIKIEDDCITILDNAAGIPRSELGRAFLPAEPPDDRTGLSEYGLGMKSAATWFSENWSVLSSALGESVERKVTFDIPKIVDQGEETLPIRTTSTDSHSHFTKLTLKNLRRQPYGRTIGKIKDHLSSIYREFLRANEVEIRYRGTPLQYETPKLLVAKPAWDSDANAVKWRKDLEIELDEDHRVSGWAGLLETGSTSDAGFALLRRRRLIEGGEDPYRPEEIFGSPNKWIYQRLVGEIHVEGFEVSHTKDGLLWSNWEQDILNALREELDKDPKPLLRQARQYRATTSTDEFSNDIGDTVLDEVAEVGSREDSAEVIQNQLEREPDDEPPPDELPDDESETRREFTIDVDYQGGNWVAEVRLVHDSNQPNWCDLAFKEANPTREEPARIGIRVNLDHPFSENFILSTKDPEETLQSVTRLAACLVFAEMTAIKSGVRAANQVRRNLNEFLRNAFAD